ncbi:hypothetical protein MMC18_007450 [Xylographa bjoerkii]|nr:hypothetical protein [Xylographa bjoerkii]MCJ1394571.1 hypothetical protein [Xylographa bjoerkii]
MASTVQAFLAKKRVHQNVYRITGIKIAVDAWITNAVLQKSVFHFHAGVDVTALGFPLSVGPKANIAWHGRRFLLPREGQILSLRFACGGSVKREVVEREFTKGALFSLEDGAVGIKGDHKQTSLKTVPQQGFRSEFVGLSTEDVDADGSMIEDDNGEESECIMF